MKDIRPALYSFLLVDSTISGLVGGERIYPVKIPQGVKKTSVVYTRISGEGDYAMVGPTGYVRPRIQIAAWAPTANEADTLARAVKARIDGYSGAMGSGASLVQVQGVFQADMREMWDEAAQLYGVMRDYFIHHEEL